MMMESKKLIEVALPLEAINIASAREKSIRYGHPSTLHLWWARRPLAAARSVIFSQMVDDPSSNPNLFPTEQAQKTERRRLFHIIEELVMWENTTNEKVLQAARDEIWKSWRRTCELNSNHPRAKELYNPNKLPAFHDPFAGGGALPLEAQRLGLEAYAGDLNPVAVLINKAMIEIPPKFAGKPPVNTEARKQKALQKENWKGAQGLAEDVRYYGQWMRDEAEKRIGHLYPKIEITAELAKERPDLRALVGQKLTVIAWLWARTVKSPNPAIENVEVPLITTFMLFTKSGKEAYVEPLIEGKGYRFTVKVGKPRDLETAQNGTKLGRGANFRCLISNTPITGNYIKAEGKAGRIGARMMAIVAEGNHGRVYLAPTKEQETIAQQAKPIWKPEVEFCQQALGFRIGNYGMTKWSDLFTNRQLVALTTYSDLVQETIKHIYRDALASGLPDDKPLCEMGIGAKAYAEAVGVYLGFAVSKTANIGSSISTWMSDRGAFRETFARQAIQMTWDFAEANSLADLGGSFITAIEKGAKSIEFFPATIPSVAIQMDATIQSISSTKIVSTDPPYYDNIGYADLSDFFYVWLRQSMKSVFPDLFATIATPKNEELIAFAYRHEGKAGAEAFFLEGMTQAMHRIAEQAHPAYPVTIYYAFKQSENDSEEGTTNTGWETFLDAVIRAGFTTSGTWPMRTEGAGRMRALNSNALASSIVIVCRHRLESASMATRREFLAALKSELPAALKKLQDENIAPVDLTQASIGPGIAVFSRYSKVVEPDGSAMSVRTALQIINQELDSFLRQEEGEMDAETQFCVQWFEQYGMNQGSFGDANTLAQAKNTSVDGIKRSGAINSAGGKVAIKPRSEYPQDWDPVTDSKISLWECAQNLIKRYQEGGEALAAELVTKLGVGRSEDAKNLAYRLYSVCERKGWAEDAMPYNELVTAWPEIQRKAAGISGTGPQKVFEVIEGRKKK
jgi:putative DNA methylase